MRNLSLEEGLLTLSDLFRRYADDFAPDADRCLSLAFQKGLEALALPVLGWCVGIR